MSTSTWTGAVNADSDDADNWSPAGVRDASSDVVIAAGAPVAVAAASIGTVNSITDSSDLSFESAGTNTVATLLDDTNFCISIIRILKYINARTEKSNRRKSRKSANC